ncbi:hypothetical protein VCRA2110O2_30086 [Vibrio crassostreae]|nr:hypothetical protein VCHA44O286_50291 [Vibrio chagasii]CAK2847549.1 hypothetical protein VCRA2110O2_30086 [Vibrio crassostreae]
MVVYHRKQDVSEITYIELLLLAVPAEEVKISGVFSNPNLVCLILFPWVLG